MTDTANTTPQPGQLWRDNDRRAWRRVDVRILSVDVDEEIVTVGHELDGEVLDGTREIHLSHFTTGAYTLDPERSFDVPEPQPFNPLGEDLDARDADGHPVNFPGWIHPWCAGENEACHAGHGEGRPVHLLPPKYGSDRASLALPDYHFATVEDAQAAYLAARISAHRAQSVEHRDELYARADQPPVWCPDWLA